MQQLHSLTINVELTPGSTVRDVACDLCSLADRVGTTVRAKFNDVTMLARPGDNPLDLAASYDKQSASRSMCKIAVASRQ